MWAKGERFPNALRGIIRRMASQEKAADELERCVQIAHAGMHTGGKRRRTWLPIGDGFRIIVAFETVKIVAAQSAYRRWALIRDAQPLRIQGSARYKVARTNLRRVDGCIGNWVFYLFAFLIVVGAPRTIDL